MRVEAEFGGIVVFHSNILHRSEKNFSNDKTRVVQLFPFFDLTHPELTALAGTALRLIQCFKPKMFLPQPDSTLQGVAHLQRDLGVAYFKSKEVLQDHGEALEWIRKCA